MKKLLLGAAALTLAFTSCKKDDNNNSSTSSGGTIKVGSTTYTYDGTSTPFKADSGTIAIGGKSGNAAVGLNFYFQNSTTPPAAGTYRLVSFDSTQGAGQVSFLATVLGGTPSGFFESTGAGSVDVTVSISNGKYKIVLPDAPAKHTITDSITTTVSANVTQK